MQVWTLVFKQNNGVTKRIGRGEDTELEVPWKKYLLRSPGSNVVENL